VITLRREETGVLVMELSEHLWPDNLELTIPVLHDVARSRRNPLLLLVVVDSDFDTPLWDFLCQILQPGILVENRPSRVAVLTKNPAEPKSNLDSEVEIRVFGSDQECEARAWLLSFATPHSLPPILG
jgi:SpoIIAA-like